MNVDFNGSSSFHVSPVIQQPWNCTAWLKLFLLAFFADMHFPLLQLSELTITKLPGDYFVIAMSDHFINCKLHYLKMVTTDIGKGTEYPNFS